tara:strand:- start:138 stop:263 length:126 start_codon:yes stop_codon:yes gene_type:complete
MSARLDLVGAVIKSGIDIVFSDTNVVWMKNASRDKCEIKTI